MRVVRLTGRRGSSPAARRAAIELSEWAHVAQEDEKPTVRDLGVLDVQFGTNSRRAPILDQLIADVAESLARPDEPLDRAVAVLCDRLACGRVSLVRFDQAEKLFEVVATAGIPLFPKGTKLPIQTSSHYARNFGAEVFESNNFGRLRDFDRACDRLVSSVGLQSGSSLPLLKASTVVGAINISFYGTTRRCVDITHALSALGGMFTVVLATAEAQPSPRLLICHDDPLIAEGLARICETDHSRRVETCATLDAAAERVASHRFDVVICDNYVGGRRVDEVVERLRRAGAACALVIVGTHDTPENVAAAVKSGAAAYVTRADAPDSLFVALAAVAAGRTFLPEARSSGGSEHLTAREREVLLALDDGLRMKQISRQLGISEATAKSHARNIFRKLGASSRAEAVREARKQGLIV